MRHNYTSFLYKDNDNYYVLKSGDTGEIIAENNDAPETLFQTGLDRKGIFEFRGDFSFSAGLTGLKLKSATKLISGPETWLRVPNGYTGDLWIADYTYQNGTIVNFDVDGIYNVTEQGATPSRLWSALAFLLKDPGSPSSKGITCANFGNMYVNNARNAVKIDLQHSAGWMTSNAIKNLIVFTGVNGVEFINTAGITSGIPGISSNTFEHLWLQSYTTTQYGIKNVMGKNNWFKDVAIWDLQSSNDGGGPGTGHSSSFSPYCEHIFVEGGIMMHYNVVNNAPKGTVHWIDAHSGSSAWQYYEELAQYQTNGSLTGSKIYTIPHGLGYTPDWIDVIPKSKDAMTSSIIWTWDSTNITITYQGTPPPPATVGNQNNVKFAWRASIK